jgi:hypothetical protein
MVGPRSNNNIVMEMERCIPVTGTRVMIKKGTETMDEKEVEIGIVRAEIETEIVIEIVIEIKTEIKIVPGIETGTETEIATEEIVIELGTKIDTGIIVIVIGKKGEIAVEAGREIAVTEI